MEFKEGTSKPLVSVVEELMPYAIINKLALTKMKIYVETCNKEVGWLGIAYKSDKVIFVEDCFLFDQEVHSTTTEITPKGLCEFGERLLMENPVDGMEIWNNIRLWGHSHVDMPAFPSKQDDDQMITFSEGGHEWFIRIIANKRGDLNIDLYDYNLGILYKNIPWEEGVSEEEQEILTKIRDLKLELHRFNLAYNEQCETTIKAEIKEKVRDKSFTTVISYKDKKKTDVETNQSDYYNDDNYGYGYGYGIYGSGYDVDEITCSADVTKLYDDSILLQIGQCRTYPEAKIIISAFDDYSVNETTIIWETAKNFYNDSLK